MQEVSSNMLAVLKSKNMIGDNRPSAEVVVGDSSVEELIDPTNWSVLRTITTDGRGRGCVAETRDGKAIAIYGHSGAIKVGFASSIKALLDGSEVIDVANEVTIDTGYSIPVASISLIDGKLLAVLGDYKGTGQRPIYNFWRDDTGLGTSFEYKSKIWEPAGDWPSNMFDDAQISPPTKLLDGKIAVFMPQARDSIIGNGGGGASVTENYGDSWSNVGSYSLGIGSHLIANQSGTIVPIEGARFFSNHLATSSEQIYPEWNVSDGTTTLTKWNELSSSADGTYSYAMTLCRVGDRIYRVSGSATLAYTTELEPSVLKNSNSYWTHVLSFPTNYWQTRRRLLNLSNLLIYTDYDGSHMRIMGTEKKDKTVKPKSIQISRAKGMAGSLTVEVDNNDGILAPDGETNPALLWPNKEIIIKQGYGQELLTTFTGLIDSISMKNSGEDGASISISARDMMKPLIDHYLRNSEFLYTLTYTNMTVEHIWENLMILAGVEYDKIEATGLTISEKTFSWESYADAVSWCDEIAGFQTYCDELGKMNFVKDGRPEGAATAYIFREGEDLIEIGYDINDEVLYYAAVCYGKTPEIRDEETNAIIQQSNVLYFAKQLPQAEYWNIPSGKILKIDAPDADTIEKCEIIVNKAIYLMQTKARQVQFKTIGVPHLQIGDFIQVIESSTTISEIYRITDISSNQTESEYTMTLTCYYHGAEV